MSGFKLAASNIAWKAEDDQEILRRMESFGYQGIEIAPTRVIPIDPYSHAEQAYLQLRAVEEKYGLKVCSMQSIWRNELGNIFHPQEAAALLELTKSLLSFANHIDCPNVVFGCPRNRNMPEGHVSDEVLGFFNTCGNMAADQDVTFAIEANPSIYQTNFLNTTEEVHSYLMQLSSEGLAINLDFGTIVANEEEIEALLPIIPLVSHVHISEPHLAKIERRTAHHQLREVLESGGYAGYVSMEMATAARDEVLESLIYVAEVFG